ncbi:hypothetical protein NZL82_11945 [Sphingomonas sanguinis]|uniref:hypothetical protein n=1 Tax=Sphingomonas sp. LC-1 TaxID=3110957 RepID=UPI0021BB4D0E|nr:hypothetical protein [Sphingomonas sp. LC-1]MCT8002590.1 hypothetical protein [Sphingomonas sp. LC-1]
MMGLDVVATLRDAWGLFRRDRSLLLRLAGPFLFWPAFALGLLVPTPPLPEEGVGEATARASVWIDSVGQWASHYGGWYFASYVVGLIGTAALLALLLSGGRATVGEALRGAVAIAPRYLLAMILVALPVGAGMLLYILPGLYVAGRLLLVGPVLLAERRMAAMAALARSIKLTRGVGLPMAALSSCTYLGGMIATQPFLTMIDLSKGDGPGNPVAIALLQAGAAAVAMAAGLAQALIAVAAYRRLVNRQL